MQKQPSSLDDFPTDVQNTVYEILANAIMRAIENGTYEHEEQELELKEAL